MNSLPKTVTRQRRGCDLNPGPSATESSTLTTLPSHPVIHTIGIINGVCECGQYPPPGCEVTVQIGWLSQAVAARKKLCGQSR